MSRDAMKDFMRWRADADQSELLDTFDLALGYYAGRFPNRAHWRACDFADKARDAAARERGRK